MHQTNLSSLSSIFILDFFKKIIIIYKKSCKFVETSKRFGYIINITVERSLRIRKMKNCIKHIITCTMSQRKGFQGVAFWAGDPNRS